MALKNTYAKLPAANYISDIQEALMKAGAIGIQQGFENGCVCSLAFLLDIKGKQVQFKLPLGWKKVQQVLKNEKVARSTDDDYAYRVSWAIMRDWIEAQMAILATETVSMPQLFLPYAMAKNGKTLYESVVDGGLLLGDGK